MAKFCSNCGAQMDDNLMFCGNCGAKVDAAPAAPVASNVPTAATPAPVGNIDFMGILKGTADAKTNWIAALVMQVLSAVLFLVPLFGMGKGNDELYTIFGLFGDMKDIFARIGYDVGFGIWCTMLFVAVCISIVYMAIPVIKNTRLVPAAALVMTITQAVFFLANFIFLVTLTGEKNCGVTFGFWAYLIVTLAALFFVGRIVVANKKELI